MRKLFENDLFFLLMTILAVVGETLYSIIGLAVTPRAPLPYIGLLFRVGCVIVLYDSYRKHSKNVMKGMMGALLMGQLLTAISLLSDRVLPIEVVTTPIFVILSAFLFINHFIINADHNPSMAMVNLNRVLVLVLLVNNFLRAGAYCLQCESLVEGVSVLLDGLGFLGLSSVVVCVESRLDAYRIDRQTAGWTEEKGYPEGYKRK